MRARPDHELRLDRYVNRAVSPATIVFARGRVWTIVDRTVHADCESVRLRETVTTSRDAARTLLTPFDRLKPVVRRSTCRRVRPRRWLHAIRRAALDVHPFGALRAAATSPIDLLPYQLEPALAIFRHGATRVLIADDVGLGKTIQAGVIVRELVARQDETRALIVTPAALREQWRQELIGHFDIAAVNADASWLRRTARALPPDVNPWSLPGVHIASFDFLKRAEALRPVEDTIWDLVVVDEAHAAAPGTDRRAAIDAVASRSRLVVLLTATPHNGDPQQFEALCRLGSASDRTPIVFFQRSREAVGSRLRRRTVLLPVRLSPAERRIHRSVERYAARIHREARARGDSQASLAAVMLRKRALSGATALLLTASRRQALLSGSEQRREQQLLLPLGDEDPLGDAPSDDVLAAPGLDDGAAEVRELDAIVRAAKRAVSGGESKIGLLLRLARRVREPMIVFTEYRDTLGFIESALTRAGHAPLTLHGGMSPIERAETQRAFDHGGSLLLATDAASEGLNLHRRCRIVVHFELPWTPMRLQQRTGRVARIGQTKVVHEILLVASDTAERLVLAPLLRRAASARAATPGSAGLFASMTESRVAAAILEGGTPPEGAEASEPRCCSNAPPELRAEAEAETTRLLLHRKWSGHSLPPPSRAREHGPVLSRFGRRALVVLALTIRSPHRGAVHSELIAVRFECDASIADVARLESAARLHIAARLRHTHEEIVRGHATVADAGRRREEIIASVLPETTRQLVQAGLFDRRSLRAANTRAGTGALLAAHIDERLRTLDVESPLGLMLDLVGIALPRYPGSGAA